MKSSTFRSGRFIPNSERDLNARVKALEVHLAALTSELAYLLAEMDSTPDPLATDLQAKEVAADTP